MALKPAVSIARRWFDTEQVDAIVGLTLSPVALAVITAISGLF